jgi:hypothetical protein
VELKFPRMHTSTTTTKQKLNQEAKFTKITRTTKQYVDPERLFELAGKKLPV